MAQWVIQPARFLQGEMTFPGDKSISHRALLFAAISQGTTRISNCLSSKDVESTRRALVDLGVTVQGAGQSWQVEGVGIRGFRPAKKPLDMGNSGTTARLLLGLLAGQPFTSTLTGDESLSKRPMRRATEPLEKMGAIVQGPHGPDRLPLTVQGGRLRGIRYTLPVASAQVKSALLLAGLCAEGPTTVTEPVPTRDHTERMLKYLGARLTQNGWSVTIEPGSPLRARDLTVPGDISSAAFFLVAAAIVPGSSVTVRGVSLNPARTGILDLLEQMGARLQRTPTSGHAWEPVGEVMLRQAPLRGISVEPEQVPGVIDELPILMVAATQAKGVTLIEGAGELRVKETDRILSMVTGLTAMGARICAEAETIRIEGPTPLRGATVSSFNDHRTAMSLAVAGLVAQAETRIEESQWVDISFPGFARSLEAIRR